MIEYIYTLTDEDDRLLNFGRTFAGCPMDAIIKLRLYASRSCTVRLCGLDCAGYVCYHDSDPEDFETRGLNVPAEDPETERFRRLLEDVV